MPVPVFQGSYIRPVQGNLPLGHSGVAGNAQKSHVEGQQQGKPGTQAARHLQDDTRAWARVPDVDKDGLQ